MVTIKQYRQGIYDPSEESSWMREGSRKFIGDWTKTYKKGYDDLREARGEQYKKFEALYSLRKRLDPVNADKDRNLN